MARDGLSIKLEGGARLDRVLAKMAITHQSKTTTLVFQSLNKGATTVRKEAQKLAPKDKGALKKSIKNKASRKNKRRNIFMALVFFKFSRDIGQNTGEGGWTSLFTVRGTKFLRPNNFMLKATKKAEPKARKEIGAALVKKIAILNQKIINGL